ncbi:four-helix bundle copper-binding protein [Nitriliruptoria bacterium AS10]|nr:four-helix bundle copper-binding protein [Salsipaludibacter albus]
MAAHPERDTFDLDELVAAIEAASTCAAACGTCADSCLQEGMVDCARSDLDCADVCRATAAVLSRPGPSGDGWRSLVETCITMCTECAEECASHDDAHCQACAEACRACAEACRALLAVAD